jgi:hypothetical protein
MKKKLLACVLISIIMLTSACGNLPLRNPASTDITSAITKPTVETTAKEATSENSFETTAETSVELTETAANVITTSLDQIIEIKSGEEFAEDSWNAISHKVEFQVETALDSEYDYTFTMRIGDESINFDTWTDDLSVFVCEMKRSSYEQFHVILIYEGDVYDLSMTHLVVLSNTGKLIYIGCLSFTYPMGMTLRDGYLIDEDEEIYSLAVSPYTDEGELIELTSIPAGMYRYGYILDVTQEFPVYSFRYGNEVAWTASPGDKIVLSADDQTELLYVKKANSWESGWIRYKGENMVLADGSEIELYDALRYPQISGG